MSQNYHFYKQRAEEAATDADGAELENVRERHLQAEKTWRGLAEQARKVEEDRAVAKQERLDRIAAEEEAAETESGE
ncbi:hypothetical protein [Aurantiacibacter zhengii]|uniref:Uncharacterized protein n=1 Tax=Aurantiacibacter zhengii TaxID=2307003 RepID=A0A418NRM6_9SPHN|nr:hypothetical protein [Aurantiacibacter zhengii]RIV85741.1 hypothetical protein D2V07_10415 [Aurantiacibacter zhengii]